MENYQTLQWQGKVQAKLTGPTADQAWAHLKDFCLPPQVVPNNQTCYRSGVDGEPRWHRYCAGPVNRSDRPSLSVGLKRGLATDADEGGLVGFVSFS
ncbi:uncharacterized protein A4U43_C05F26280 [Asparagus officinalis]|uniref:Uncharacterized protein n=1 Tax=Asparagus officinalis TaxID=4686 RepID=A0A5P1EUM0_ASPOF|nr:uncharacterized protein A4U43_C05F26280 [Asparagus officinalis]